MKIIITKPPQNCWGSGYPIHKGNGENSLNKATLHASQQNILPDSERLKLSFNKFKETLELAGFNVIVLTFPEELDKVDCLHYDAVFIRDSGLMFKNFWIKAQFSAISRQIEAEVYAKIMKRQFQKQIISLPKNAFLEFGEVIYLQTSKGSFYFGGLSRANKIGHDFVKELIRPDHYCLIKSKGYHLDTVFTPVVNKNNELVALIVAKDMLEQGSFDSLRNLGIEIIVVNNKDSSDEDGLGNYAVNCLVGKGVMISGSGFTTPCVEERLKRLGIKFYIVSLIDFNFAGGSVHCLTNEIYG